jgi:uncharacterized membrane protein
MARKTKQMADRAASHWRLAAGLAAGIIAWTTAKYFGAPKASHLLLGWDVAALVYLLTTWTLFLRADEAEVRERAARGRGRAGPAADRSGGHRRQPGRGGRRHDRGQEQRGRDQGLHRRMRRSDPGAVVAGAAVVIRPALRPSQLRRRLQQGGIQFPGERPTSYMDFAYLAFSVGATFQVSDNSILTLKLRKLVTAHAATAYFYNTAILALGINIIAALVGG